jgi:hypothetical protein
MRQSISREIYDPQLASAPPYPSYYSTQHWFRCILNAISN